MEYDVHFSINGFYFKVDAPDEETAARVVENWLEDVKAQIEKLLRVGVGVEIADIIESE